MPQYMCLAANIIHFTYNYMHFILCTVKNIYVNLTELSVGWAALLHLSYFNS